MLVLIITSDKHLICCLQLNLNKKIILDYLKKGEYYCAVYFINTSASFMTFCVMW